MIPKIIHLCWLSGDPFPPEIQVCLDSWKKYLPDYEIWLWDTKRFDIESSLWVKQAFTARKYAFAADYIRLYALYKYGGIYMDSDVVVYKSFDDLLSLPFFLGEDYTHCFEAAIIGAEPGLEWIKVILDRYETLPFINEDGSYNMRGLPYVFYDRLSPIYRFYKVKCGERYDYDPTVLNVFPSDFFNSRDHVGIIKTKNSYCAHNYMYSWAGKRKRQPKWKKFIPRPILNYIYMFYSLLLSFKESEVVKIPYTEG